MNSKVAVTCITVLVSTPALSADLSNFPPTDTPYGWIAPVAVSQLDVSDGNADLYRGWFDNVSFAGDLVAHSISTSGAVSSTTNWSAKALLDARDFSNRMVIKGSNPTDNLCDNTGVALDLFLCGDNSSETKAEGTYRDRASDLGTIIHSNPVHVGKPRFAYNFDDYLTFRAQALEDRAGAERIYVGANDGMLHAFDSSGNEIFGYIPSMVESKLASLASGSSHQYMVDGPLVTGDAYADFNSDNSEEWATLLVGGLGAGGKGYFALDVTTPVASGAAVSTVAAAKKWEFAPTGIGYTYGAPVIARTNDNKKWALIAPNGYAEGGEPILYIRDIHNPAGVIKDFDNLLTPATSPAGNGLSSPAAIDMDGDFKVDYVYAGDLDGNLWRFDISADENITTEWTATKIFTATDGTAAQPILAAPELARLEDGTVMVFFGTGDPWSIASAATHSFYALKDDLTSSTSYSRNNLQQRATSATSNSNYLTLDETANPNDVAVDWTSQTGWFLDLGSKEQVLQPAALYGQRVQFLSHRPDNRNNWFISLDYKDGRLPDKIAFDTNADGNLDVQDNIGYDADAGTSGVQAVGRLYSSDLISGPVLARRNDPNVENDEVALTYFNSWNQGIEAQTLAAKSCTNFAFDRFDFVDEPESYGIKFIAHLSKQSENPEDTSTHDIWVMRSGMDAKNKTTGSTQTPDDSSETNKALRGAGEGKTANGVETWNGLNMYLGDPGSKRVSMNVEYQGPYEVKGFTIEFINIDLERIHDGITKCSCTGSYNLCGGDSERVRYDDGVDGVSQISFADNTEKWKLIRDLDGGMTKSGSEFGTQTVEGKDASGNAESGIQPLLNGHTGRLRWRELIFGE